MRKTVLIVGAAGTLGRKVADLFKEDTVILCDVKECLEISEEHVYIKCDICNPEDVKNVGYFLKGSNQKIDVLLYGAGIYERGTVEELSLEQWKKSLDINVTGLYLVLHELMPYMKEYGKIIAVASQFGLVGSYESAAYCASKAAMINLIRSVALDFDSKKICANCVCPGFFESEFLKNVEKNITKRREWMSVMSMLPKSKIQIDDVVSVIKMLSENESITGQCITVDGGYTAR